MMQINIGHFLITDKAYRMTSKK